MIHPLRVYRKLAAHTKFASFLRFSIDTYGRGNTKNKEKKADHNCRSYSALFIGLFILAFHYFIMPIDIAWMKIMNRLNDIGIPVDKLLGTNNN